MGPYHALLIFVVSRKGLAQDCVFFAFQPLPSLFLRAGKEDGRGSGDLATWDANVRFQIINQVEYLLMCLYHMSRQLRFELTMQVGLRFTSYYILLTVHHMES